MPVGKTEFTVPLTRVKLWSLLNDLETLGKCVPGCEEVQVLSPHDSRWKVKLSVGIISRRIQARAHITERLEPERITLTIDSLDGDLVGTWNLELLELTPESSKVTLVADMTARGGFEWVVNQVISSQMKRLVSEFADCIARASGTRPSAVQ